VVEGKLEISGAVSETIFRADADTTLQLDASDAANALLIMDGANTDTINLPGHYTINAAESQGRGGKVAYDPPHPGKASHDDSKINDIAKEQPAHPHYHNF